MAKTPIPKDVVDNHMAIVDAFTASRELAEAIMALPPFPETARIKYLAEDALTKLNAVAP